MLTSGVLSIFAPSFFRQPDTLLPPRFIVSGQRCALAAQHPVTFSVGNASPVSAKSHALAPGSSNSGGLGGYGMIGARLSVYPTSRSIFASVAGNSHLIKSLIPIAPHSQVLPLVGKRKSKHRHG